MITELEFPIDFEKLLHGRYEEEILSKILTPERAVPDFAYNVLNQLGLLYRPIVDERYVAQNHRRPLWPGEKTFAACLTHDADILSMNSFKQDSRRRTRLLDSEKRCLKKLRFLCGWGVDLVRRMRTLQSPDPLHRLELWLEEEKKYNAHSTFFFWPGWKAVRQHHLSDCVYDLDDQIVFEGQKCTIAELIREIDHRGWEIGLHPSWHTWRDADEMLRQKEVLERILGHEIISVRQHYLHYDIRTTPRVQAEVGFKYDSTLGFNDNIGFRFGTSYPFQLHDLQLDQALPIMEIPLIVQDISMLCPSRGLRLDEKTALDYMQLITERVESVGGIVTLLWHPDAMAIPARWQCYQQALQMLNAKNAYFGSVQEVAEAFKKQNSHNASSKQAL